MVLRGSKTVPIADPVNIKQAIDNVRKHLLEARKEKSDTIGDLHHLVHVHDTEILFVFHFGQKKNIFEGK